MTGVSKKLVHLQEQYPKPMVLVADDQIGMLETFTGILEDKGLTIVTAGDGNGNY